MTLSTTTNRVSYTGNGVTTAFSFPYYFLADADLTVVLVTISTGAESTLVLNTDYTITGAGSPAGGTVTTTTAYSSSYNVVIYRNPALTQSADFVENQALPAATLEQGLDRATMIDQRTRELVGRSIRQPEGDTTDIDYLPPKVTRASKYLAFDADGDPIATAGTADATPVSAFMATVLDDTTASAARTTLGLGTAAVAATGTSTGNVPLAENVIGKQTIWVPAGAMVGRTTNGAASGTTETTTNKVMLKTLDFDTSTQEFAQFMVRMPKSWNESTVTAQFDWTAASGSGGVVWAIEGLALTDDDAYDQAFGTAQTATDTLIAANDRHASPATSAVTIAGSPAAEDCVVFQVKRNVSDGSDTLGVDAKLIGVTLFYTTDTGVDA